MSDSTNINRRTFLKGTGLVAGTAAITSVIPLPAMAEESKVGLVTNGTVINAAHWGPLKITVENGKITKSTNAIAQTMENSLQTVTAEQVYNESRIKYPYVRKGYLDNPSAPTGTRGDDTFVKVTWEQAYDLIEKELKRVYKDHGASSIFGGSYGWRSSASLHKGMTLLQRFLNLTGGYTGSTGDYSTGAAQVIMPHVVGSIEVYEQQTSWPLVIKHADVVVLWAMNPLNTLKIAWSSSDCQGLEYFKQLKASGKKVICINPISNETVDFFGKNATLIQPRPNTDVAMMLGIAHTLVKNKWHDTKFLAKYTAGYDKFEPYLLGKSDDNIEKTAEWASKICGVPAATIEELASIFHKNKTMLMAGWGLQRQHHGEQGHWMLVTLASMLGQIGQDGSGFGFSYHYANGGTPTRLGGIIPGISASSAASNKSDWESTSKYSFPVGRIADALLNPGKTIQVNGGEITYPDIKVVWWCGGNPFTHHQDTNRLRRAWQKPDTVIVQDPFWTPTAKHADIVLPITTSFERNDLTMTGDYSNMHIVPMKQVIAPLFESKSDFDVFSELSVRFNVKDKFTENKDEMQWLKSFYDEAQKVARTQRINMPSFGQFWNKNEPFENKVDPKAEHWVRFGDFRKDPIKNPLGTPSGKFEIYSATIAKMGYDDCPAHPTWMEPAEYLGNATDEAPFHMVSEHPPHRLHSQLNQTSLRREYAVANREPVFINPDDAKAKGIANGDLVRVFNKRGQVLAGAVISNDLLKGVVDLHEGAWFDPVDGTDGALCKNGSANVLTLDIGSSQLGQGNCAQTALVNIEKYTGDAPNLTAFKEPKFS